MSVLILDDDIRKYDLNDALNKIDQILGHPPLVQFNFVRENMRETDKRKGKLNRWLDRLVFLFMKTPSKFLLGKENSRWGK